MRYFIIMLFISIGFQTYAQQLAQWNFDEGNGSTTTEQISNSEYSITNNYDNPEWVAGINGEALRFDGWSTWISGPLNLPADISQFSVSLWTAIEANPVSRAALINQQEASKGFGLEVGMFGKVYFRFYLNQASYQIESNSVLNKYQWNNIVATFDADAKKAFLYINGVLDKEITFSGSGILSLADVNVEIGKHNQTEVFGIWPTGVINGIIDEIELNNRVLNPSEIQDNYNDNLPDIEPDLSIPVSRHANDPFRPQYHPIQNTHWTNESYGLIHYEGLYHMFYQKNPNGPYLRQQHWGHLTSPDLVAWQDERIAMAPEPGWDNFGVWSGDAVIDNDSVKLIYTGVDGVKAGIGIAYANERVTAFDKEEDNPLIAAPPEGTNHLDFRDPYVWKNGDYWYMIVGSGINNEGGILFTYKSKDLLNWENITPLYQERFTNSGIFWEMPVFFPLTPEKYILTVTPVFNDQPAKAIYWIGEFKDEIFVPDNTTPKNFTLVPGNLLSPTLSEDTDGNIVAVGIIPETRSSESQSESGWSNLFSLPRVLRLLEDGNIGQIPHPNLCRLRDEQLLEISNQTILKGTTDNLSGISGDQMELHFKLQPNQTGSFEILLRMSEDRTEFTKIIFNERTNTIAIDRRNSSLSDEIEKDVKEVNYAFESQDTLDIRIFIDRSVIEVFVDNLTSFVTRVYPAKSTSNLIDLVSVSGELNLIQISAWQLSSKDNVNSEDVCEPEQLPTKFREEDTVVGLEDELKTGNLLIFPNPAFNYLIVQTIHKSLFTGNQLIITDAVGRMVFSKPIKSDDLEDNNIFIDIEPLQPGWYTINLMSVSGHEQHYGNFIVIR